MPDDAAVNRIQSVPIRPRPFRQSQTNALLLRSSCPLSFALPSTLNPTPLPPVLITFHQTVKFGIYFIYRIYQPIKPFSHSATKPLAVAVRSVLACGTTKTTLRLSQVLVSQLCHCSRSSEILSNVVYEKFRKRILQPSRLTQAATSTPSSNRTPPMTFVSNS